MSDRKAQASPPKAQTVAPKSQAVAPTATIDPLNKEILDIMKFLANRGLKQKDGVVFDKRVTYFRGDDVLTMITEHGDEITKMVTKMNISEPLDTEKGATKLLQHLIDYKKMFKFEREPENKFKWPKRLMPTKSSIFSDKAFYCWVLKPEKGQKSTMLMWGIIGGILAICLFPVWPIWVKIGLLYLSVTLLYTILGTIVSRLVLYIFFKMFGIEFWLLPNLFADAGPLESLSPLFYAERSEEGKVGWLIRVIIMVTVGLLALRIYHDPNVVHEYKDMGTQSFEDLIDWGKQKLDPNQTRIELRGKAGFKSYQDILKETDESIINKEDDDDEKPLRTPTLSPVNYDDIEPESESDEITPSH
jgi:translocation protein SEC62